MMRLECLNLCCDHDIYDVNLQALKGLRELRLTFEVSSSSWKVQSVSLSDSISSLTDLEVLHVGTSNGKLPWNQYAGALEVGK
jgi:hypothetical protein